MYRIGAGIAWCILVAVQCASAQSPGVSIDEIDRLREKGRFEEARDRLQEILQSSPDNVEALWRLSRTHVNLGEQESERDRQEERYRKGIDVAVEAVAAGPESDEAHLAYAIAAGRLALISGTREKVELSRIVKENIDRAIELNPNNPAALHVRARWNYGISDLGFFERAVVKIVYGGLPKASFEAAVRDFQRAIELDNRAIHHLELGKTYLKLGREAEARACFQAALDAPPIDPADPIHKQEARAMLSELGS